MDQSIISDQSDKDDLREKRKKKKKQKMVIKKLENASQNGNNKK